MPFVGMANETWWLPGDRRLGHQDRQSAQQYAAKLTSRITWMTPGYMSAANLSRGVRDGVVPACDISFSPLLGLGVQRGLIDAEQA